MDSKPEGTVWVCVDCIMKLANDENPTDPQEGQPAPLALWFAELLTVGQATDCGCGEECDEDCDTIPFSSSRCDGCGSSLAGQRHAVTYWSAA